MSLKDELDIDKIAYEVAAMGYVIRATNLKDPKNISIVEVFKDEKLLKDFLFPFSMIYKIANHAEEFIIGFEAGENDLVYGLVNSLPQKKIDKVSLNDLARDIYLSKAEKRNTGEALMLIVSELSGALDAHTKDRRASLRDFNMQFQFLSGINALDCKSQAYEKSIKDTLEDKIADALIGILYFCGEMEIDISAHLELKLQYNFSRRFNNGKKY